MTKINKTDAVAIGFCLDESLSMMSCLRQTISGFNEYLGSLAKQKGKTTITLTQFSATGGEPNFRVQCEGKKIEKLPKLNDVRYRPRGNTPLFDAIGTTISKLDAELKAAGDNPPQAIVVIQTDGEENASREYSREQILKMITKREKKGWVFIFLGADMDEAKAAAVGGSFGATGTVGYTGAEGPAGFAGVAMASAAVRTSRAAGETTASVDAANLTRAAYRDALEDEKKKPKSGSNSKSPVSSS